MRALTRTFTLLLALLLVGCGFQLQGAVTLPAVLASPQLVAADRYTPFHAALVAGLQGAGARLTTDATRASAVIRIHRDESRHDVLSVTARNTPGEYEVFYTVEYSVSAGGQELLPLQTVSLSRGYGYDEMRVLAKEHEERTLREALARDIASQVMRRLGAL